MLPLAFGEAGLPVPPALREALAAAAASNGYGPVAGAARAARGRRRLLAAARPADRPRRGGLRAGQQAAAVRACCWRSAPTSRCPEPSWVSYAAQAGLIGARCISCPAAPGEGGICDPGRARRGGPARPRAAGRQIGSVVVTLPDNPTGGLARPATVRALCRVADEHGLIIISDEIYRDLVHDPAAAVLSPAASRRERTVVTTALSKNLALGGWRIGVARMPDGPLGRSLREPAARRRQRDLVGAGRPDPARGGRGVQ